MADQLRYATAAVDNSPELLAIVTGILHCRRGDDPARRAYLYSKAIEAVSIGLDAVTRQTGGAPLKPLTGEEMKRLNAAIDLIEQTFDFPKDEFKFVNDQLTWNDLPLMEIIQKHGTPLRITADYRVAFVPWPLPADARLTLSKGWRVQDAAGRAALVQEGASP